MFSLMYHGGGGWTIKEIHSLPIKIRNWFVLRLTDQLEREEEALDKASRGK